MAAVPTVQQSFDLDFGVALDLDPGLEAGVSFGLGMTTEYSEMPVLQVGLGSLSLSGVGVWWSMG